VSHGCGPAGRWTGSPACRVDAPWQLTGGPGRRGWNAPSRDSDVRSRGRRAATAGPARRRRAIGRPCRIGACGLGVRAGRAHRADAALCGWWPWWTAVVHGRGGRPWWTAVVDGRGRRRRRTAADGREAHWDVGVNERKPVSWSQRRFRALVRPPGNIGCLVGARGFSRPSAALWRAVQSPASAAAGPASHAACSKAMCSRGGYGVSGPGSGVVVRCSEEVTPTPRPARASPPERVSLWRARVADMALLGPFAAPRRALFGVVSARRPTPTM
jgi:hypothetical protein